MIEMNKMCTFIKKKLPSFYKKNCLGPTYKEPKPRKSVFIKNLSFETNRDPCLIQPFTYFALLKSYIANSWTFFDIDPSQEKLCPCKSDQWLGLPPCHPSQQNSKPPAQVFIMGMTAMVGLIMLMMTTMILTIPFARYHLSNPPQPPSHCPACDSFPFSNKIIPEA